MKKHKPRKIYTARSARSRYKSKNTMSIISTIAVIFGVVVLGYNFSEPITKFFQNNKETQVSNEVSSRKEELITDSYTKVTTVYKNNETKTDETKKVTTTATNVKETQVTTSKITSETPEETIYIPDINYIEKNNKSYYLNSAQIANIEELNRTLGELINSQQGYTSVILPLKVTGGKLNYNSQVNTAKLANVIDSDISLSSMVEAIKKVGFEPIAELSTVTDHIYPIVYKKSAYQFDDNVTGEWLDHRPEEGGKPWLSPFSDLTKEYLKNLSSEIADAGITKIIYTDLYFPPFREKDLNYIGDLVKSPERYKGLTNLVNEIKSSVDSKKVNVLISVSAKEAINGTVEVLKPNELNNIGIVVDIDFSQFPNQNITQIMQEVKAVCGNLNLIPCILKNTIEVEKIDAIAKELKDAGYVFYLIK